MSDQTPYTPSLEQVADNYVEGMSAFYGESGEMEYRAQFGRLVAQVRAEAWDEGALHLYDMTIDETEAPWRYWAADNPYRGEQ